VVQKHQKFRQVGGCTNIRHASSVAGLNISNQEQQTMLSWLVQLLLLLLPLLLAC
jgi:hypothetical protein